MEHSQTQLASGFDASSSAEDVLRGRDLNGRTAIVTGGHSGLGQVSTLALLAAGAQVIVAARVPQQARASLPEHARLEVAALDLGDQASVGDFAERFLASGRHVDILLCNAGIMACPLTRLGPGWEAQLATNHLGHYALVNRLWPALRGGARVVALSSAGHWLSPMRWDDPQFEHGYDKWLAYGQSKTANALFAVQLDRLGREHGVRAFSVHPGKIATPLQRHLERAEMVEAGWLDADGRVIDPDFKTPAQGAATQLWAATSPQLDGRGGLYCEDGDVAELASAEQPYMVGVRDYAVDPSEAARLWRWSADTTGVDAFASGH